MLLKDIFGLTSYLVYGGGNGHYDTSAVEKFKLQRFFVDNFRVTQGDIRFRTEPTWQNFKQDTYLQQLKDKGIKSIWCTQGTFDWFGTQGKAGKVMPLKPGADPLQESSWQEAGELCRQVAIRYAADTSQHLSEANVFSDPANPTHYLNNTPKAGLDLIDAIEIQNEWDFKKEWSGADRTITPEEYAVCFKVCYDAIRTVSPSLKIIMGGTINPYVGTFTRFLTKLNSLYQAEGKTMPSDFYLCFHWYMRDGSSNQGAGTAGISPEDANAHQFGLDLDELCRGYNLLGWYCTETGWATDNSKQQAPILEGFTKEESQGILMVRLALIWGSLTYMKGITYWHCRDDYDLPPYAKGGINYKNWQPKPARIISEDYLNRYGDHAVSGYNVNSGTHSAKLDSLVLSWTNLLNSGHLTPKPEAVSVAPIYGCTDQHALNYNPNATADDRSCIYAPVNSEITLSVTENGKSPIVFTLGEVDTELNISGSTSVQFKIKK